MKDKNFYTPSPSPYPSHQGRGKNKKININHSPPLPGFNPPPLIESLSSISPPLTEGDKEGSEKTKKQRKPEL